MRIPKPDITELQSYLPDYTDISYVATGGFKVVFSGWINEQQEAIKAIYIPSETDGFAPEQIDQLIARAKREIETLEQCTGLEIVKRASLAPLKLSLSSGNYLVYSEEFLSGRALADVIQSGIKPDNQELARVFGFLISVMEQMIRIGYLHRDIKPANIIVTETPERPYVILDMGIAYKIQGTQLTQGPTPPGTLRYMAPELLQPDYKDVMDFRCDLYSSGLTMYELASGIQPFAPQPQNDYATMYRVLHNQPEKLEALRPDLPLNFCRIIDRCIKKRPALRYARLELLRKELEEALS